MIVGHTTRTNAKETTMSATILHIETPAAPAVRLTCDPSGMYPTHITAAYRPAGALGWTTEIISRTEDLRTFFARPEIAEIIGRTDPVAAAEKATAYAARLHREHVAEQRRMDAVEAADRRVTAIVEQDETHVWWIARVIYTATGRPVHRAADEGGTHAFAQFAIAEAEGRAQRECKGATITRIGYSA
jgi:hypothetical protein